MLVDCVRYPARAALLAAMLTGAQFAQAADPPAKAKPPVQPEVSGLEVVTLTIHPQKLPTPVLKYHLLPTFLQQTPGNAVPLYAKAFVGLGYTLRNLATSDKPRSDYELVDRSLEAPLEKIPRDRATNIVEAFGMPQVELAVRRERCDWDPPLRQGRVFEIRLPEVQESRLFAKMFALKARLRIAEGRYADAIEALQGGYSLARQVAKYGFVVSALNALAVASMMNVQMLTLCQQPGAPNLYWSLTELPHPIINLEKCLATEYDGLYLQWPELQNVRRARNAPDQWNLVLQRFVAEMVRYQNATSRPAPSEQEQNAEVAKIITRALDNIARSKADLVATGYAVTELDAMPPAQIVMLHTLERYDRQRDELFKWMHVPYWQAEKGIAVSERELAAGRKGEIIPVASLILPAPRAGMFAFARNERELAALRCIEALRLYLANHDAKLPTSLDEIKEVPIPLNPVTGKPFPYHLEGAIAVLEADGGPTSGPMGRRQTQYRIAVAK